MKLKRRKKLKTYYEKRITVALWLYCLYVILCAFSILISFAVPRSALNTALIVSISIASALFIGGSAVMLFCVVPYLKKKQAKIDFERCDFSPYISEGESEVFEHEYLLCSYIFKADIFDCDEEFIFDDENTLAEYFKQFTPERLLSENRIENDSYSSPFFIGNYFGENGIKYKVKKKLEGDKIYIDLSELHRAEFTTDGIRIGDKLYGYSDTQAEVLAYFHESTNFMVSVRIIILFGEDGGLSFIMSSRIAAVVERFKIRITNREMFDYILKDPKHAYEQTAMQLNLRKLK